MITSDTPAFSAANVYTDLTGLARLRQQANQNAQAALPEVAQQFEALFLHMLLKSMRQSTLGDPLLPAQSADFYSGLFDHQMSLNLARSQSIGLADLLVRELRDSAPMTRKQPTGEAVTGPASPFLGGPSETRPSAFEALSDPMRVQSAFDTPESFVQTLLPHAQKTARSLGVAPEVLIAQAALETGWGRAMIRHPNGENSFNLFGIKADGQWRGSRVVVPTIEFMDGVMQRRQAAFRAYATPAESFEDYTELIGNSPRYRQALASAADPIAYVRGLQAAGYATDPRYAEKVVAVMNSPALGALKQARVSSLD
jgi:flagellar protein FlgJ